MKKSVPKFHHPPKIELQEPPLLEAWLEIRWHLDLQPDSPSGSLWDNEFLFALGVFYKSIRSRFGYREDLAGKNRPENLIPYFVRHRFRPKPNTWPVIQLGPGVATVNFTAPSYSWEKFQKEARFLRAELLDAYGETGLRAIEVSLRYRNGQKAKSDPHCPLDFFSDELNTTINLPDHIPGLISAESSPSSANIFLSWNLKDPPGIGSLRLATGVDKEKQTDSDEKIFLWQLEVISRAGNLPDIKSENDFSKWLRSAHAVIHEWFFSLIDGSLREKYERGGII